MTYTALAIVLMLAAVAVGARSPVSRSWPAALLAVAIVMAQLALLVTQ